MLSKQWSNGQTQHKQPRSREEMTTKAEWQFWQSCWLNLHCLNGKMDQLWRAFWCNMRMAGPDNFPVRTVRDAQSSWKTSLQISSCSLKLLWPPASKAPLSNSYTYDMFRLACSAAHKEFSDRTLALHVQLGSVCFCCRVCRRSRRSATLPKPRQWAQGPLQAVLTPMLFSLLKHQYNHQVCWWHDSVGLISSNDESGSTVTLWGSFYNGHLNLGGKKPKKRWSVFANELFM